MKKIVLSSAFLLIGTFAMAQQVKPHGKISKEEMEMRQQARISEMKKELNLNDSQVAKIVELDEKARAERKEQFEKSKKEREARKSEMIAKKEKRDKELKNILSPEQYEKWQASRKAKMEERKAKMKEKGINGERKIMKKAQSGASI